jgi:hypothetical protein
MLMIQIRKSIYNKTMYADGGNRNPSFYPTLCSRIADVPNTDYPVIRQYPKATC